MSLVAEVLHDGDRGPVRAYPQAAVARAFDVTAKTIRNWTESEVGGRPKLRGWAPRSATNPSREWMIDADDVDLQLRAARGGPVAPVDDQLAAERKQLEEERQTFELERAVWRQDRIATLEEENARLRDEVGRLRAQVSALGSVVHDLTREAL